MSARQVSVIDILSRYVAGYFPLYDLEGKFYWERLPIRAMMPVNEQTVKRARQLARRGRKKFEIRYTTAVEEIIAWLQKEEVKENSWVKEEVIRIYRLLHGAKLLRTVEAWQISEAAGGKRGGAELMGALLGIQLPGTFIAETMFGLVPEASKVCLCQLVQDCFAAGTEIIDVQTPHDWELWGEPGDEKKTGTPHPCVRLGEIYLPISAYQCHFVAAWKRAFSGTVEEWVLRAREHRGEQDPRE